MTGVCLLLGCMALLVWGWLTFSSMLGSAKSVRRARQLKASGDWKAAAASYKLAIVKRLNSEFALPELVEELQSLYRANGVHADLRRVLECPTLQKQIWATKVEPREKGRLIGKLYGEIGKFLDGLP